MTPVAIGPHRLFLGDAYAIRPALGWFDADVLDPPYKFRAEGGGKYRRERKGGMDMIVNEALHRGFEVSIVNPLLCGAAVVFAHTDQLAPVLAYMAGSFHRHALCVWRKLNPQPLANKHYRPDLEFYVHAWHRDHHPTGSLAAKMRLTVAMSVRGKEKHGHATVKPAAVMDKIMANVAGAKVCDPFMGTGSTGVAAIKAGKTFTGIEHNPKHFETAVARITAAYEASQQRRAA